MGKKKNKYREPFSVNLHLFINNLFLPPSHSNSFFHRPSKTPLSFSLFFFRPLMGISPLQCNSTIISSKWYDSNHDQFFNRFLFNCMLRRVFLVFTDSPRFRSSLVLATNLAHSMHLTRPLSMIQSRTHV